VRRALETVMRPMETFSRGKSRRLAGDVFLLCGDGVWEMLSWNEMEECPIAFDAV